MAKTIKQRLDDLERRRDLPVMVFEQTWDNPDLFYLAGTPNRIMAKAEMIDKKDLMTRAEALEKTGANYRPLFIVYVKDWRALDNG